MGADLIVAIVPFKEQNVELKVLEQRALKSSKRLKITSRHQELWQQFVDDEENTLTQVRMTRIIKDFFACLTHRDVAPVVFGDITTYITGGMSWGDSPTDSYDAFCDFTSLPQEILDACGVVWELTPKRCRR